MGGGIPAAASRGARSAGSGKVDDLAAAALALLLLLPGISAPFWNRDEAEYAAVARGMARGGSLAFPSLFGRPFSDKPPLSLWLSAASFRLFGESEAAGRLPHVVLAIAAVVLVRRLAARLSPGGRGRAAAAIFATSLLWVVYARLLLTDSALVFFDLAAILGIIALEPRLRPAPLAGAGFSLGLALLAKGPVAFAAPVLFLAGSVSARFRPGRAVLRFVLTASIAAAIAAPWWLGARAMPGTAAFFGRENVGRFLAPMEHHSGPIVYYIPVILIGLFPWAGFLARPEAWRTDRAGRRLALWAAGITAFFSLSATKLPHYLLPALPAFAMLASRGFERSGAPGRRAASWFAAGTGSILFAAAVEAAGRVEFPAQFLPVVRALALTALLSLAIPIASGGPRRLFAAALLPVAAISFALPPALERGRSLAFLGREARIARIAAEPIGGWRIEEPALAYYADAGPPAKWSRGEEIADAIASSPSRSALVWVAGRDAPGLARGGRIALRALAAGANLLEDGPRGDVLLCRAALPRGETARAGTARPATTVPGR